MIKYKYIVRIGSQSREVTPTNLKGATLQYDAAEDNRFSYYPRFRKKIVLMGNDFQFIYEFEKSSLRCQYAEIDILRECGGLWAPYQTARVSMSDAEFDPDRCEVQLELKIKSNYDCYDDIKKIEVNLFEGIATRQTVKFIKGTIETVTYTRSTYRDFYSVSEFPEPDPKLKGWKLYYYRRALSGLWEYGYAREKYIASCSETFTSGWIVLIDNCPTNKTLVRNAIVVAKKDLGDDQAITPPAEPNSEDYPYRLFNGKVLGQGIANIDNGLLLADVLSYFSTTYCSKPVKSDFFQINPDAAFATTYPMLPDKSKHNILFQKSDIKRPDDFDNATIANIEWEKLILALCNTYNLKFVITDTHFQIEHVSYFNRVVGLDTTLSRYKSFSQSSRYTYSSEEMPQEELFKMMEAANTDFIGKPIFYVGACTAKGKKKNISTEIFTTDMQHVMDNGVRDEDNKDSGKVSDEGFVLVACEKVGSNYYVLREAPILDTKIKLNNSLSWAHLHRDYWKWGRPQKNGYMNGQLTSFNTTIPIKKGQKIIVPFCCDESLKLTDFVKTKLGNAIIGDATYNLYAGTLEISPIYSTDTEVFICHAPLSFTFDHREDALFYFNTVYPTSGSYTIEVQWSKDGGEWTTIGPLTESNGLSSVNLGEVTPGTYVFRKRIVCGFEQSDWTSEQSVVLQPTVCPGVPQNVQFLSYDATYKMFNFRMPLSEMGNGAIVVEVTQPSGASFTLKDKDVGYSPTGYYILAYPGSKPPFAAGGPGQYKFRFRWECLTNVFGAWSDYLIVNI